MQIPFIVKEPGVPFCAGVLLFFLLRYLLKENRRDARIATCAFLCLAGAVVTESIANGEGHLISTRYDLYVYHVDQLLHIGEPGGALGALLLPHVWGLWVINLTYGFITGAVLLLLMAYDSKPEFREVVYAILVNLALAPLLYAACPVSGPQFAFSGFPNLPAFIAPHVIQLDAAPNGVPSVHFSVALVVWWYARRWRLGLVLATVYVFFTAIATLASGQHYVFDLLIAMPHTMVVVFLARRFAERSFSYPIEET